MVPRLEKFYFFSSLNTCIIHIYVLFFKGFLSKFSKKQNPNGETYLSSVCLFVCHFCHKTVTSKLLKFEIWTVRSTCPIIKAEKRNAPPWTWIKVLMKKITRPHRVEYRWIDLLKILLKTSFCNLYFDASDQRYEPINAPRNVSHF